MSQLYQPTKDKQLTDNIYQTKIKGLFYLKRNSFSDNRGFFAELAHLSQIEKVIKNPFIIKQINHSQSLDNVIRGFHAENWNKLTFITAGLAFCVLVDIQPQSDTFTQTESFRLGFSDNALTGSLFISSGIANSICVLKGPVEYTYCVDKLYKNRDKKGDQPISLFDPDLNISWPIPKQQMIISQRDKNAATLRQLFPEKFT